MLVVISENPVTTSFFLFSKNWCHDLNSMSRPHSLCLYCISCRDFDSMSRPHFCCQPLCFLVTAPLFMLQRHSVVLSLQEGRDSTLLVCLFSYRDVVIRSQPSNFFNQCNSYHDLKSWSRPDGSFFLLRYLSRPQFHVAASFLLPTILILVVTTFF